jgi:hypothetical protein
MGSHEFHDTQLDNVKIAQNYETEQQLSRWDEDYQFYYGGKINQTRLHYRFWVANLKQNSIFKIKKCSRN